MLKMNVNHKSNKTFSQIFLEFSLYYQFIFRSRRVAGDIFYRTLSVNGFKSHCYVLTRGLNAACFVFVGQLEHRCCCYSEGAGRNGHRPHTEPASMAR